MQTVGARSDNWELWNQTVGATRVAVTTAGYVGIGTANPQAMLQVNDDVSITGHLRVKETIICESTVDCTSLGVTTAVIHDGDSDTKITFGTDIINIEAGGVKLLTCEEATTDAVIVNEDSNDVNFRVESNNQGNMLLVDGGTDRVGIATSAPTKTFHVRYSTDNSSAILADGLPGGGAGHGVLINNVATNVNSFANLDFRANDADGRIAYTYEANNQGSFHFIADNGSAPAIAMTIKSNANVGIGTTLPSGRLHVENNNTGIIVANDQITGNAFEVFGEQGNLLTVTDDLSDSLFSVNDAAGMPVFEVFADDTIKSYRNNESKLEVDPENNRIRLRDNAFVSGVLTTTGAAVIGGGDRFTAGGTHLLSVKTANNECFGFGASDSDLTYVRRLAAGHLQLQTYNGANIGVFSLQSYGGEVHIGGHSATAASGAKLVVNGDAQVSGQLRVGTHGEGGIRIGSWQHSSHQDYGAISHEEAAPGDADHYGLLLGPPSDASTYLNAADGRTLFLRVDNADEYDSEISASGVLWNRGGLPNADFAIRGDDATTCVFAVDAGGEFTNLQSAKLKIGGTGNAGKYLKCMDSTNGDISYESVNWEDLPTIDSLAAI